MKKRDEFILILIIVLIVLPLAIWMGNVINDFHYQWPWDKPIYEDPSWEK